MTPRSPTPTPDEVEGRMESTSGPGPAPSREDVAPPSSVAAPAHVSPDEKTGAVAVLRFGELSPEFKDCLKRTKPGSLRIKLPNGEVLKQSGSVPRARGRGLTSPIWREVKLTR